jgi:hypothetical protein
MFGLDAVVLPLLSTTNQLDPRVLPLMRDSEFTEERWRSFREEWILFTSHRGGHPWLGETKSSGNSVVRRFKSPRSFPDGAEIGGNSVTNGANPDEKAEALRADSPVLYRVAEEGKKPPQKEMQLTTDRDATFEL